MNFYRLAPRLFCASLALGGLLMAAPGEDAKIESSLLTALALDEEAAAPFFIVFLLGMFWKRASATAGFFGMVAGTLGCQVEYLLYRFGLIHFRSPMASSQHIEVQCLAAGRRRDWFFERWASGLAERDASFRSSICGAAIARRGRRKS